MRHGFRNALTNPAALYLCQASPQADRSALHGSPLQLRLRAQPHTSCSRKELPGASHSVTFSIPYEIHRARDRRLVGNLSEWAEP